LISQYQKGKTSLNLHEARDDGDGSGISWTVYANNMHLTPDTNTSSLNFYRPDVLPDVQPTIQSTEGTGGSTASVNNQL